MFVQTELTPNPNSLKFIPGETVSNSGSFEITNKEDTNNELARNLLSINGVTGIFLGLDFISINKSANVDWEDIKHIVGEIEKQIIKILDTKIRPAVAKDGGDIKFKEFKNGVVKVELQGSCSGCPSSTMTLKQGVQNLLCHYLPEVKEVVAI